MLTIDTTNMCSHLQAKLFEPTRLGFTVRKRFNRDDASIKISTNKNTCQNKKKRTSCTYKDHDRFLHYRFLLH